MVGITYQRTISTVADNFVPLFVKFDAALSLSECRTIVRPSPDSLRDLGG